jgi:hypothetical protein
MVEFVQSQIALLQSQLSINELESQNGIRMINKNGFVQVIILNLWLRERGGISKNDFIKIYCLCYDTSIL